MTTWFSLIQEQLDLAWLAPSPDAVPFGLTGVPAADWQTDGLESINPSRWRLTAHTATGLEAQWEVVFFDDTRALECWGTVTHRGHDPVRGIRECLTLDLNLRWPGANDQPWVRSVNGVRFLPNFFPPHDFAVVDRQLLHTPQVYTPLVLTGLEDGRSSGENLPCAILCDERQTHGLGFFIEWSGLWRIAFRQEPRDWGVTKEASSLQVQTGLCGLNLHLKPGQSLPLPRVLVTAFDGNLEDGGNSLRRHIRRHVTPQLNGQETLPPASFNHWFAFGNEFTAESLQPAVEACAAAGLEYFVVDSGWFVGGFRSGIGNWELVDASKFPDGIAPFAQFVASKGMKYGTWFEPEWAHQDSALYRQHPDWFWPTPGRSVWTSFVSPDTHLMNFGLPEVRQWWLDQIVHAYEHWHVRWIRWDYNQAPRPNWEHGVADGEVGWRQVEHITGLYRVFDDILHACPDLFIEQCASGGHRIDLGTIRRGHSFWMNDHTTHSDIVRALQHGLNTVLPGNYANTNLCQKRHNFTEYDFLSHAAGGFGYSGRLWEAPAEDFTRFADAVRRFKQFRPLLLGDYHRPTGPPARAIDHATVVFSDAGRSVTMEFNPPGREREARLTLTS
ncbi:MAG: alpha-galactosidase [Candidatus Latescibacteria bacterium]|nr:alpha-galactosidase [Candidatus Latescibacterota bacterium]